MGLVRTFGEFKDELKREAKINDAGQDTLLLELCREVLFEIVSQTKNLRDFRIDQQVAIAATGQSTIAAYFAQIEQIYYEKYTGATFQRRWELTEASGVIIPAPLDGYPDAYTLVNGSTSAALLTTLTFFPLNSATIGDKVRYIGAGYKVITDDTTEMPYVSFYPLLKRSVLQRLQIMRNVDPNKSFTFDKSIERAVNAAGTGTADVAGNTNKDE